MALWLMGAVSMAVVATQDFYTIDRLLAGSRGPEAVVLDESISEHVHELRVAICR